jgi:ATP-dependent DNA ligase
MDKAMTFHTASPADLERAITDPDFCVEPKLDGVRAMASVENGKARLLNRNGTDLSAASTNASRPAIIAQLERDFASGTWKFDGEIMPDGKLWLFDVIHADSIILPTDVYSVRRAALEKIAEVMAWSDYTPLRVVSHAVTEDAKRDLLQMITHGGGEGVMLKRLDRPYTSKRVKHSLKWKLIKTADCIVTARNTDGHTNAELSLHNDAGQLVNVGNVSMIGRPDVPVGTVLEVTFLYVGANGRLYQPRVTAVRDDKTAEECLMHQLTDLTVNKTAGMVAA